MGTWSVDSVNGTTSPSDENEIFGNNFLCHFKLTYKPSMVGSFVEAPRLDWHEKFIMIEHHSKERWVFEKNMFEHNPNSPTMVTWCMRYITAYDAAHGQGLLKRGSVKLVDKMNQPVKGDKLTKANNDAGKAESVRDYLKRNGGSLLITIHDVPGIRYAKQEMINGSQVWQHKERLLLFNCGVVGGGLRFKAMQHLEVDGTKAKSAWKRDTPLAWTKTDLPLPNGYKNVQTPDEVSRPRDQIMGPGKVF